MNFKLDKDLFLEKATSLGVKVNFNSENPGLFLTKSNEKKEQLFLQDLFPEITDSDHHTESFFLPGIVAKVSQTDIKVKNVSSSYKKEDNIYGAA